VCVPNRSPERKRQQRNRWFRNGQKWSTGCEGRISVVKRRHGLNRCRYKTEVGMQRWVGLGVISDNLVNRKTGNRTITSISTRNQTSHRHEGRQLASPHAPNGRLIIDRKGLEAAWRRVQASIQRNRPAASRNEGDA
jgi:hypothetical protein